MLLPVGYLGMCPVVQNLKMSATLLTPLHAVQCVKMPDFAYGPYRETPRPIIAATSKHAILPHYSHHYLGGV